MSNYFHFGEWRSYDLAFDWLPEMFLTYVYLGSPDASKLGQIYQCLISLGQALDSFLA